MPFDLDLTAEDEAFRAQAQAFFATEYPQDILERTRGGVPLRRADYARSQAALNARGWGAPLWPKEHGGAGWPLRQYLLFDEALERAGAANVIPMGVIYVGPLICAFGTPAQQAHWLPDILSGASFWAQGYSEPEAGSDLANVALCARREGDDYILDGEKIWTSMAHWADWIFCLARTERTARKQDGLSFLCVNMNSAGVRVHPIRSMDGSHHLNRVVFDRVRAPVAHRIGAEGEGWRLARFLLQNERASYAHVGRKKVDLERLLGALRARGLTGSEDIIRRLARIHLDVVTLAAMVLETAHRNDAILNATLKILATETAQAITEIQLEIAGDRALAAPQALANPWSAAPLPEAEAFPAQAAASYLFERAQSLYGGATEIQKNIIAKAMLST